MPPQLRKGIKTRQGSRPGLERLIENGLEENPVLEEGQAEKGTLELDPAEPAVDGVMGEAEPVAEAPKVEENAKDLKEIDWGEYLETYGNEVQGSCYADNSPRDYDRRPSL